jgi:predicted nucleic acid-binding protein
MVLVDTDVLIECLRGTPVAQSWLATLETTEFSIPGIVAMELIVGCSTKARVEQTEQFLAQFPILWPNEADVSLAYRLLIEHRFTGGLGIPDCLIAAQALNHAVELFSFNLRHFSKVKGLAVYQPYPRP